MYEPFENDSRLYTPTGFYKCLLIHTILFTKINKLLQPYRPRWWDLFSFIMRRFLTSLIDTGTWLVECLFFLAR